MHGLGPRTARGAGRRGAACAKGRHPSTGLVRAILLAVVVLGILVGVVAWQIYVNTGVKLLAGASLALEAGRYAKAAGMAARYALQEPRDWRGHYIQGQACLRLARYDDARVALREASRLKPDRIGPIVQLANTYAQAAGKLQPEEDEQRPVEVLAEVIARFEQANQILTRVRDEDGKPQLSVLERLGLDYQAISDAWRAVGERLDQEAGTAEEAGFSVVAAVQREQSIAALAESRRAARRAIQTILEVVQSDPTRPQAAKALVALCIRHGDEESLAVGRQAIMALEHPPAIAAMRLAVHELKASAEEQDATAWNEKLRDLADLLDRLLTKDPGDLQLKLARAEAAFLLGDGPRAEEICQQILAENPRQGRARLIRANLRLKQADYDGAEHILFALTLDYPDWAEAHFAFARVALLTEKKELARAAMRRVTHLDPKHAGARAHLARFLLQDGFYDEAYKEAQSFYQAHPEDPAALRLLIDTAMSLVVPEPRAVEGALRSAESDYQGRADMLVAVAYGYDKLGETRRARAALRRATECTPTSLTGRVAVAQALQLTGRLPEAEQRLNEELVRFPKQARVHFELGRLYAATGRMLQAVERFEEASRLDSTDPRYLLALARAHFNSGDLDRCEEILDDIPPGDGEANLLRMQAKLLRGKPMSAERMLGQLGGEREAGLALAMTYLSTGRPQQCVNICLAALKDAPDDRALRFLLGHAYLVLGETNECLRHWSLVLHAAPRELPPYLCLAGVLAKSSSTAEVRASLAAIPGAEADMVDLALGWVLSRLGEHHAAAMAYGGLADRRTAPVSSRSRARLLQANALAACGEFEQALGELDQLALTDRWRMSALQAKARVLLGAGRPEDARTTVSELTRLAILEGDAVALRSAARLHSDLKDPQAALAICDELRRRRPRDPRSYLLRAAVLSRAGRAQEAFGLLRKSIQLQPGNYEPYLALVSALDREALPREALTVLDQMAQTGPVGQARATYERGRLLAGWGLREQAIACYRDLMEAEEVQSPGVQLALGRELAQAGQAGEACAVLERVSRYASEHVPAQLLVADLEEDRTQALDLLDRLGKEHPDDPRVLLAHMRVLLGEGRGDQAVEAFRAFASGNGQATVVTETACFLAVRAMANEERYFQAAEVAQTTRQRRDTPFWRHLAVLMAGAHSPEKGLEMSPEPRSGDLYDSLLANAFAAAMGNQQSARAWSRRVDEVAQEWTSQRPSRSVPARYRVLSILTGQRAEEARDLLLRLAPSVNVGRSVATELAFRPAEAAERAREASDLLKATIALDLGLPEVSRRWALGVLRARPSCQWASALVLQSKPDAQTRTELLKLVKPADSPLTGRIRASLLLEEGKPADAAALYAQIEKSVGGDPYLRLDQAMALERAGQLPRALELYEQVWEQTAEPLAANNAASLIAQLHPDALPRLQRALGWMDVAVHAAPNSAAIQDTQAWLFFLTGRRKEALSIARRAVKRRRDSIEVHYHLGVLENAVGDPELSRWHFEAAMALGKQAEEQGRGLTGPQDAAVREAEEAVQRLTSATTQP
jgi:tetratricopeptide (TPR) repeat protein